MALDLAIFGKLPFYEDYLRFHCSRGSAGEFRDWMLNGYANARRTSGVQHRLGHQRRALLTSEDHRTFIVAILRDSHDKNNERSFPFAVYTVVKSRKLAARPSQQLAQLLPLWSELEHLATHLANQSDLASFNAAAENTKLSAGIGKPATGCPIQTESATTPVDLKLIASQVHRVRSSVEDILSGRVPIERRALLRIALSPKADVLEQASAWLHCLENSKILPLRRTPASMVFPTTEGRGDLWLILRDPNIRDFGRLCDAESQDWSDPRATDSNPPPPAPPSFREKVREHFGNYDQWTAALCQLSLNQLPHG